MGKVASTKFMKKYTVTVPRAVREFLELKPGDYIDWIIEGDKVFIAKGKKEK